MLRFPPFFVQDEKQTASGLVRDRRQGLFPTFRSLLEDRFAFWLAVSGTTVISTGVDSVSRQIPSVISEMVK